MDNIYGYRWFQLLGGGAAGGFLFYLGSRITARLFQTSSDGISLQDLIINLVGGGISGLLLGTLGGLIVKRFTAHLTNDSHRRDELIKHGQMLGLVTGSLGLGAAVLRFIFLFLHQR